MVGAAVLFTFLVVFSAVEIPNFERVLLPMHDGDTQGASGSVWRVEEVIFNQSDEGASFYPHFFLSSWFEATVQSLPPFGMLPPSEINQPGGCRICPPPPHPGAIIYIQKDHRDRFVLYDRIYESNIDHDNHGTVIPAVPESDFRHRRTTFPSIPVRENFRSTLRIYNLAASQNTVSVRLFGETGFEQVLQSDTNVVLPAAYGAPWSGQYKVPLRPGFVQLVIESLLPLDSEGPIRVVLEADSADAEYWAFVSVTSKTAQRVTIFVPSP